MFILYWLGLRRLEKAVKPTRQSIIPVATGSGPLWLLPAGTWVINAETGQLSVFDNDLYVTVELLEGDESTQYAAFEVKTVNGTVEYTVDMAQLHFP